MQGRNDLDSLLDGEPDDQVSAVEPVAVEPQAEEPDKQDATTGDETNDAAPPAAVAPEDSDGPIVPRAAYVDERRKRQELDKRIKELEAELAKGRQAPQQEPQQEVPDWYTDPESAAAAMRQSFDVEIYQTRVALSEDLMRERHPDYDEVSKLFAEAAGRDQALLNRVLRHPNPAKFAYDVGRQIKLVEEVGSDPDAYRNKIEAEILAKYGLKPGETANPKPDTTPAVPRSLARNVSQQPRNSRGQFDTPASLDELLDG